MNYSCSDLVPATPAPFPIAELLGATWANIQLMQGVIQPEPEVTMTVVVEKSDEHKRIEQKLRDLETAYNETTGVERTRLMTQVIEDLQEKGNTGTFFQGNPEAYVAFKAGLKEGAGVVFNALDKRKLIVTTMDGETPINVDYNDDETLISLGQCWADAINT
jgi:hypothetical protein